MFWLTHAALPGIDTFDNSALIDHKFKADGGEIRRSVAYLRRSQIRISRGVLFGMLSPLTWMAMIVALSAHTGASIFFKKAAQQKGTRAMAIFALGNVIGFINPICKTIALRNNNPNVIFAIMGGLGGIIFVFVINWVFQGKLTRFQWFAILIIIFGSILLQFQPSEVE